MCPKLSKWLESKSNSSSFQWLDKYIIISQLIRNIWFQEEWCQIIQPHIIQNLINFNCHIFYRRYSKSINTVFQQETFIIRNWVFWNKTKSLFLNFFAFHNISPGAHFTTKDFLPAIPIRWKLRLLAIRSQQIFAHATTAQLSCHVQNFVAITVLKSRCEWKKISSDLELQ